MTVVSVEPVGYEDVFNMEVDDIHDFTVNGGVIVHNCYDEWRYVCMRNPIAPPVKKEQKVKPYDPLDIDDDYYKQINRQYEFYRRY